MMLIERATAAARRRRRLYRHCAPPVTAEQVAASSCDPGTAGPRFVVDEILSTFLVSRFRANI